MPLSQELRKRFAAHVGADESATEDALFAAVATELDARKTDIESFSKAKLTLTRERDEALAKVTTLELSRDSQQPNPPSERELKLVASAHRQERDLAIAEGVISKACADELDAPFFASGKPTTLALSMAGAGDDTPIVNHIYQTLRKHKGQGVRQGNGVTRIEASRNPAADGAAVDLGNADDPKATVDSARKEAEEYQKRQQQARGIAVA